MKLTIPFDVWAILSLQFSPDEQHLLVIVRGKDYSWKIFCFAWPSGLLKWNADGISSVGGFTPDALAVYLDDKLYELSTGKVLGYQGYKNSLISPDGKYCVVLADGGDRDGTFLQLSIKSLFSFGSPWIVDERIVPDESRIEPCGFLLDDFLLCKQQPSGKSCFLKIPSNQFQNPAQDYVLAHAVLLPSRLEVLVEGVHSVEVRNALSGEIKKQLSRGQFSHVPLAVLPDGSIALMKIENDYFVCHLGSDEFSQIDLLSFSLGGQVQLARGVSRPRGFIIATQTEIDFLPLG
jgi:hypothetical protein